MQESNSSNSQRIIYAMISPGRGNTSAKVQGKFVKVLTSLTAPNPRELNLTQNKRCKMFYLQLELFYLQLSFFAYSMLRRFLNALSNCKQRSSIVSKKAQIVSTKTPRHNCKQKSSAVSGKLPTVSKNIASKRNLERRSWGFLLSGFLLSEIKFPGLGVV